MSVEYADRPVSIVQLHQELLALGLPGYRLVCRMVKRRDATGIRPSNPYLLVECGELSAAQRNSLDNAIAAHSPAFEDTQAAENVRARTGAAAKLSAAGADGKLLRALVLTLLDEINTLRSAAGLAPRTAAQLRTAIQDKIGSGGADTP